MTTPASHSPRPDADIYDDGYLHIEYSRYYVVCGGQPLYQLARKELLILFCLARAAGRPVAGFEIWAEVWRNKKYDIKTLRVYITNLRRKLSPYSLMIVNQVNVGYSLVIGEDPYKGAL
jgi:DNA-binding response OmpR family regulator